MTARLALLPQALRRGLALLLAGLSLAVPAALLWISAGGLVERWTARAALAGDVAALGESLADPDRARPAGAGLSLSIEAADAALNDRADRLAEAFQAQGAAVLRRQGPEGDGGGGVVERRLTLAAAGAPDAIAAALTAAAGDATLAVRFVEMSAPRQGAVEVRLVLVAVVAGGQGS